MAGNIKIVEYHTDDVDDSVRDLWLALAQEMFKIEHFILPSKANSDAWVKFVREGLVSDNNFLLVAKCESKSVGFVYASFYRDFPLEISEKVGAVNEIYVLPDYRRKGIGKKLMAACISKLKTNGVDAVRLMVLSSNEVAMKLFEQFGFKIFRYGMTKALEH